MLEMTEPTASDFGPHFQISRKAPRVAFDEQPEPFDYFLGDRDLAAASQALAIGQWEPANTLVSAGVSGERLRCLGERTTDLTGVQAWVENAPSPASHCAMGFAVLAQAWPSKTDDPAALEQFLASADGYFAAALQADAQFVHAYEGRIDVARVRADVATARKHFEAAHAIEPFSTGATYSMTKALAPEWGGSVDDMMAFARWVVEEAPTGTPACGVIADAHFQIATGKFRDHGEDPLEYMTTAPVQEDLETALRSIIDGLEGLTEPAPVAYARPLNMLLFFMRLRSATGLVYGKRAWGLLNKRATWMPWALFSKDGENPNNFFLDYQFQRMWSMQEVEKEIAASKGR